MNFEEFKRNIEKYLKKIDMKLEEKQEEQLYQFMKLLIETNKKMNLTAITDENDIILKHFIDSIIIQKYIEKTDNIIDVGTGAGFPGIPLKIINQENEMVLLDSLNKRIIFIEEIIEKLRLKKLKAVHIRAEEAGKNAKYREKFDIATSRAVSKLNVLIEYLLPLVKLGGSCICLKGPNIKEELEEAKNAIEILGGEIEKIEEYNLPESDIGRNIIVVRKIKNTPNKYPRKAGTPSVSPLK